jgi:hypothetical protein
MSHGRFKVDVTDSPIAPVVNVVGRAQELLNDMVVGVIAAGGLSRSSYARYLTFQYHLTRDVQRAFLSVASHATLADRRQLREFLFRFALEEEPHYAIAENDLAGLGEVPGACPLDVSLWWAYYRELIPQRPFRRLGATCVLENLGAGAGDAAKQLLRDAPFVTAETSRFIQIHFHEALPHGDQIYRALTLVDLSDTELRDLRHGAAEGAIMYLRMAQWALDLDPLQSAFADCMEP